MSSLGVFKNIYGVFAICVKLGVLGLAESKYLFENIIIKAYAGEMI